MPQSTAILSNEHHYEHSKSQFNRQSAFSATLNILEHGLADAFKPLSNPISEKLPQASPNLTNNVSLPANQLIAITPNLIPDSSEKASFLPLKTDQFLAKQTLLHTISSKTPTSIWLSLNQQNTRPELPKLYNQIQENGKNVEAIGVPIEYNQTPYRTYKKNTGQRGIVLSQKSQTASPWNDPVIVASIQAAARNTLLEDMIIAGQHFKLSKV